MVKRAKRPGGVTPKMGELEGYPMLDFRGVPDMISSRQFSASLGFGRVWGRPLAWCDARRRLTASDPVGQVAAVAAQGTSLTRVLLDETVIWFCGVQTWLMHQWDWAACRIVLDVVGFFL